MRYLVITLLALLTTWTQPLLGNEHKVNKVHLPTEIVTNRINSILRTSDGLMWIGTASGLSRYDGYGYVNFQSDPTDSTTLLSNYVSELTEDPRGILWIKTDQGFSVYDFAAERLVNDSKERFSEMGINGTPNRIITDKDHNLWIYVDYPTAIYVLRPGETKAHRVESKILADKIISGMTVGDNYLILANRRGQIILVDRKQGLASAVIEDITPYVDESRNPEVQVYADNDNMLWIWTTNNLWLYDLKNRQLIDGSPIKEKVKGIIRVIMQDDNGRIWLGQDHRGVTLLAKYGERGAYELVSELIPELTTNTVECLYDDENGSVWVGTSKHGLFSYSNTTDRFDIATIPDVNVIAPASNNIAWVGTDGDGLWNWNSETNESTQIANKSRGKALGAITCLSPDAHGGVYIGTYGTGLQHYSNGQLERIENPELGDADVWALLPYGTNGLWIGTLGKGLYSLDFTTGKATLYAEPASGIPSNFISSLTRSQNGLIYIGTDNGIGILDPSSGIVGSIPPEELSSSYVNQVMCDSRGLIWIATRNGLDVYNPQTDKTDKIDLQLSSSQPHVLGLAEDLQGHIWVSVGSMLCCINVTNLKDCELKIFNSSDGLTLSDFNQRSLCELPNGTLAAGGLYGISYCLPRQLTYNFIPPKVIFTSLSVNGRQVTPGEKIGGHVIIDKSIVQSPLINVYDDENSLTFFMTTDDFIAPERTRFFYQLNDDEEWIPCAPGGHAFTLYNLRPGKYKVRVKAVNSDDCESVEPAEINIVVHQSFWRSPLAWVIYSLLAIALIIFSFWYIRRRERLIHEKKKQEEELEKQEQLNQMKLRFFTNISHELRTPLTLIISPLEKMISETQDPQQLKRLDVMHRNSIQLLNLVNQIMDFRKSEMYGLQLQLTRDDIVSFCSNVLSNFRPMADAKGVEMTFESNESSCVMDFDSDKIDKMLYNLLSNALKFTPSGGKVTMSIKVEPEKVYISVIDNGVGISDEDKRHVFERFYQINNPELDSYIGTGIGLNMVWEYARLHGGKVRVEDNPSGKGTVLIVDLPRERKDMDSTDNDETSADEEASSDGKPTIMLVDDNPDILDLLSDNLGGEYRIMSAIHGKEAWLKMRENKPDLIISDIMMPVMDGIELCRKVKSESSTASIPFIILTAKHDITAKLEGLTIGADDYITKPFNNDELLLRVKKLLQLTHNGARRTLLDPKPAEIQITSMDEKLVEKAVKYVETNMDRSDLSVEELASNLGMSRVHLYKKLTQITGKSPVEFIRLLRLKRAAQLLRKSQQNISEIAFATGFGSPKYFSKYFKEEYGILPSVYQQTYGV